MAPWKCPICKKPVGTGDPEFPFCSKRCRTQDLANWASGKYAIHTPLYNPEAFGEGEESLPEERDERKPPN